LKTKAIILLVLVALTLLAFAAPALAAPPAAADQGLHNAHCKTMGTPGHQAVPFECDMMMGMECDMMECGMHGMAM
jgi:hypothetical protein